MFPHGIAHVFLRALGMHQIQHMGVGKFRERPTEGYLTRDVVLGMAEFAPPRGAHHGARLAPPDLWGTRRRRGRPATQPAQGPIHA
jgi:hypothetical protein